MGSPDHAVAPGVRPGVPRATSWLAWVWACWGQWGRASGAARLVLEAVVPEGQHVQGSEDVLGAGSVSCVSTARMPVTTPHAGLLLPLGVCRGGSAFGACAPHGCGTRRAGSWPALQAPAQIPEIARLAGRGTRHRRRSHRRLSLPYRLEYLQQKQNRATSELERQVLEKQAREAEKEVQDIK